MAYYKKNTRTQSPEEKKNIGISILRVFIKMINKRNFINSSTAIKLIFN